MLNGPWPDVYKKHLPFEARRNMHIVHNERAKLRATLFNTVGIALIVVGGLTPVAGAIYVASDGVSVPRLPILVVALGWICGGIALHLVGIGLLGRLRE